MFILLAEAHCTSKEFPRQVRILATGQEEAERGDPPSGSPYDSVRVFSFLDNFMGW
jgi:hypothetical protein